MTKQAEAAARRKVDLLIQLWKESGMQYIGFPVESYNMRTGDTDNIFHLGNVKEWHNHNITPETMRWANELWKQLHDKILEQR
jgi:hypothetical protein